MAWNPSDTSNKCALIQLSVSNPSHEHALPLEYTFPTSHPRVSYARILEIPGTTVDHSSFVIQGHFIYWPQLTHSALIGSCLGRHDAVLQIGIDLRSSHITRLQG